MSESVTFAAAWLRQRTEGAREVQQIEDAELRALDAREGLRLADALLSAVPLDAIDARRGWSGLVEQQRLFARARR